MPRFKNAEEKLAFMKSIAPVLLTAGVPSVERKNDQGETVIEVDPTYLDEISKDDRSKVADRITALMETKKNAMGYASEQMRAGNEKSINYWGRFRAEIIDLGTEENERWNLTMSRLGTTRAGQAKMLKYIIAEMFSVDTREVMDMVLGEKPIDMSPKMLRVCRVGFLADNMSTMVEELSSNDMSADLKKAVIRQLKISKSIYEDYLSLISRLEYSTSSLGQCLPSDFVPNEKIQDEILNICSGNKLEDRSVRNEVTDGAVRMYSIVTDVAKFRKMKELDERMKRELGDGYVDLINDRGVIIRNKKGEVVTVKEAIDTLTADNFPEDAEHKIRDLFSFDHIPQEEVDLLKTYVEEELKKSPILSEAELKEEKELREQYRLEQIRKAEEEKKAEGEKKLAKEGCRKLNQMITDKMKASDPLLRHLSRELGKMAEGTDVRTADELSGAALSVIHENGSIGSSAAKKNKTMIALAALAVVKPRLAKNLSAEILRANPNSGIRLEQFMKDRELRTIKGEEADDFDFDWYKNNSHTPADMKTALEKINKDLDPWYHHNSPEFKVLNSQMKTYLTMLGKKPMSQSCARILASQVREAAIDYITKNGPEPRTSLGENRLKMAIAVLGVMDPIDAENQAMLVNAHRSAKNQLEVEKILRLEGLKVNLPRERKIGNMVSDIISEKAKLESARDAYKAGIEACKKAVNAAEEARKAYQEKENNTVSRIRGEINGYAGLGREKTLQKAAEKRDSILAKETAAKEQLKQIHEAYAGKTADFISKTVLKNALARREHDLFQSEEMERRGTFTVLSSELVRNKRFLEIFKDIDPDVKMIDDGSALPAANQEALDICKKLCDHVLKEQGISKKVNNPAPSLKNRSLEI